MPIDHDEPCPITRPYPQPFQPHGHEAVTRVASRPAADSVTRIMAAPARAVGPLPPPCPPPRRAYATATGGR